MKPTRFCAAVNELLSYHEVFRRLGFLAGHLYVDVFANGVQFCLRFDGPKAEPVFVVNIPEDFTSVAGEWPLALEWWNKAASEGADKQEMTELFEKSWAWRNRVGLLLALSGKGLINAEQGKEIV
jgi:hypothetical protein